MTNLTPCFVCLQQISLPLRQQEYADFSYCLPNEILKLPQSGQSGVFPESHPAYQAIRSAT